VVWPAGAQFLIRFTGPELWWVLGVAHRAAGVPMATVAVPPGAPGVLAVGGGTVLAALLALLLRRLRWLRTSMRLSATASGICLLAWSLSGLLAESRS
jgi:competence protein ComEC